MMYCAENIIVPLDYDSSPFENVLACYDIFSFVEKNEYCRFSDITSFLRKKYGDKRVLISGVKDFCRRLFKKDKDFTLSNEQKIMLLGIKYVNEKYKEYLNLDEDKLLELINKYYFSEGKDIGSCNTSKELLHYYNDTVLHSASNELKAISVAYHVKKNEIEEEDVFGYIVDSFLNFGNREFLGQQLWMKIENLDEQYENTDISNICEFTASVKIYRSLGINTLKQLMNEIQEKSDTTYLDVPYLKLASATLPNNRYYCSNIIRYLLNFGSILLLRISDKLPRENYYKTIDVIKQRYSNDGELQEFNKQTLESTGQKLGVTRERVRQIEAKLCQELLSSKVSIVQTFDIIMSAVNDAIGYITLEEVIKILNDRYAANFLAAAFDLIGDEKVSFDAYYKIFYFPQFNTIDDIKKKVLESLDTKLISFEQFNNEEPYVQRIISTEYKKSNFGYILNGTSKLEITYEVIENSFPKGYHIDSDDYAMLLSKIDDLYGEYSFAPSDRSIAAGFERHGFVLCDRGTYISSKYAPVISDELLSRISDYILDQGEVVMYSNVFNKFENELKSLGITNQYYFKGLIDPRLDKEVFFTSKSSIRFGSTDNTISNVIAKYFEENDKIITIKELQKLIPGIEEYKLFNRLMSNHEIIQVSGKSYVHRKYIGVNSNFIDSIESITDELFTKNNLSIISAGKIYANIKLLHPEVLDGIKYIDNDFGFYSLMTNIFANNDKYRFKRPYVSISDSDELNANSIIMNKVLKVDRFSIGEINRYLEKIGIHRINNVLEFINELSEIGFMTVGLNDLVKIDVFKEEVGESSLKNIGKIIDQIMDTNGTINTSFFHLYKMFPTIKYSWNKYLLKGYIMSFMSDKYEIEDTDGRYDHADFIIRKVES